MQISQKSWSAHSDLGSDLIDVASHETQTVKALLKFLKFERYSGEFERYSNG
jgi:hypothetical protein